MTTLVHGLAASWWSCLIPVAAQFAIVFCVVALIDRLLPRRTWPQLRVALWLLAMAKLALPPGLASPWSVARWAPALPSRLVHPGPADAGDVSWALAIPLAWLAGVVALVVLGAARARRFRRLWDRTAIALEPRVNDAYRRATELAGVTRAPRVVVSPHVITPLLAGALRPAIYLPGELAADLGSRELELVLVHELAHWRRKDAWLSMALGLLQIVFWFHPFVWMANARVSGLREQCCDRTVLRWLGSGHDYRRALLSVAARTAFGPIQPGLTFVLPRASFALRLELLLDVASERAWLRRLIVIATLVGLGVTLVPMARAADGAAHAVADLIDKPPGCLPLRMMVLQRMAQENDQ